MSLWHQIITTLRLQINFILNDDTLEFQSEKYFDSSQQLRVLNIMIIRV